MTLTQGRATRLTILLHTDATWHHHSMSDEIVHRALQAGLAGGSVFHGIEGYGRSGVVHTSRLADIMDDLPCAVEIIDPSEERVRSFLMELDDVLDHGLLFLDSVEVVMTAHRPLAKDA